MGSSINITLYIDGNTIGTTPYNGSLTFGNHILKIEKDGKKSEKEVTIAQVGGETNYTLSFGKNVNIDSEPIGANIYIDGNSTGKTPYFGILTIGKHILRVEKDNKIIEKNINISQAGKEASIVFNFDLKHKIGENYAGGIIFYVDERGEHGLVCAPIDQAKSIKWYNRTFSKKMITRTGIGKGSDNTKTIIESEGIGDYAAQLCFDLIFNGYSDWFLPSKDELNLMYINLKLKRKGRFSNYYYWSSSDDEHQAWYQNFDDGTIGKTSYYGDLYSVRAIRFF